EASVFPLLWPVAPESTRVSVAARAATVSRCPLPGPSAAATVAPRTITSSAPAPSTPKMRRDMVAPPFGHPAGERDGPAWAPGKLQVWPAQRGPAIWLAAEGCRTHPLGAHRPAATKRGTLLGALS